VVFDPLGNATALWLKVNGITGGGELWLNRYTPASGWSDPENVRSSTSSGMAMYQALAVDALGRVTVVWREMVGDTWNVMAGRFE
jgi:hypothetical protein